MFSYIYNTLLYKPLYNTFIGLVGTFPFLDAGIVVIIFTIIIKLILFPISQKSVRSQIEMKKIQPEIDEIKLKYKDNKQEQALKTMNLYKERGINPFSGVLLAFIQLPILIALYMVFYKGGLTTIRTDLLYPFISVPEHINKFFLGLFDITQENTILALVVGLSQFFQIRFTLPAIKKTGDEKKDSSFQSELAKSMNMQMKYVMPAFMFFIAISLPSLVSLYLITSSFFAIGQELYQRRKNKKEKKNVSLTV
jgi:YidC/Oxa1 family membrane protein insertase